MNRFSSVHDVAYMLYSGVVGVIVSSRGSMLTILLELEPLHHLNAWTINSRHDLTRRNLLSMMRGWNDKLNSELDMVYAYLG